MTAPTPAISSFTDSVMVHAADLNSVGANLTNLYNYTMAGFRTLKPQCVLRVTGTQSIPVSTDTQISWDVADVNTDSMWSSGTPGQMTVQTAGIYMLYLQTLETAGFAQFGVHITVNGTSISGNSVAQYSGQANGANVSALVSLGVGATIFGFIFQGTAAAQNLATTFGGSRMAAHWVGPQ